MEEEMQDLERETQGAEPAWETEEERVYTQAELEAEADRRVTQALRTAQARLEREHAEALEAQRTQAENRRLSEAEEQSAAIAQRERELDALKEAKAQADLRAQTAAMLGERNLAALGACFEKDLSKLEGRTEMADALSRILDRLAEARMNEALKSETPPRGVIKRGGARNTMGIIQYPTMGEM